MAFYRRGIRRINGVSRRRIHRGFAQPIDHILLSIVVLLVAVDFADDPQPVQQQLVAGSERPLYTLANLLKNILANSIVFQIVALPGRWYFDIAILVDALQDPRNASGRGLRQTSMNV